MAPLDLDPKDGGEHLSNTAAKQVIQKLPSQTSATSQICFLCPL